MPQHLVTIHQLVSESGRAFLNINDTQDGIIEAWGSCFQLPVYLVQKGIRFHLFVFDDKEYAREWEIENISKYQNIVKINPLKEE